MSLKEEIQRFVCNFCVRPARDRGETRITIVSGDLHRRMRLSNRMPAVCNALRGAELQHSCKARLVKEIRRPGVKLNSSTNQFVFELVNSQK